MSISTCDCVILIVRPSSLRSGPHLGNYQWDWWHKIPPHRTFFFYYEDRVIFVFIVSDKRLFGLPPPSSSSLGESQLEWQKKRDALLINCCNTFLFVYLHLIPNHCPSTTLSILRLCRVCRWICTHVLITVPHRSWFYYYYWLEITFALLSTSLSASHRGGQVVHGCGTISTWISHKYRLNAWTTV